MELETSRAELYSEREKHKQIQTELRNKQQELHNLWQKTAAGSDPAEAKSGETKVADAAKITYLISL